MATTLTATPTFYRGVNIPTLKAQTVAAWCVWLMKSWSSLQKTKDIVTLKHPYMIWDKKNMYTLIEALKHIIYIYINYIYKTYKFIPSWPPPPFCTKMFQNPLRSHSFLISGHQTPSQEHVHGQKHLEEPHVLSPKTSCFKYWNSNSRNAEVRVPPKLGQDHFHFQMTHVRKSPGFPGAKKSNCMAFGRNLATQALPFSIHNESRD